VFRGQPVKVEVPAPGSFRGVDIALFSAGGTVSEALAPQAASEGAVVVDNTSAFRLHPEVPLVVPEVNPEQIAHYKKRGIIANPNCSTIQLVVALKPLEDVASIRRVVVSTFQAVSGAGQHGIMELKQQLEQLAAGQPVHAQTFPRQIAFNCVPQIGRIGPDGYSVEEHKIMDESRKILSRPDLRVTATTVRVPVIRGHSEAVNVELDRKITAAQARALWQKTPGVKLLDEPEISLYPTALDAAGGDLVLIGRVREDPSRENSLDFWCVADNLRKGAALNAVQIAEILAGEYL